MTGFDCDHLVALAIKLKRASYSPDGVKQDNLKRADIEHVLLSVTFI